MIVGRRPGRRTAPCTVSGGSPGNRPATSGRGCGQGDAGRLPTAPPRAPSTGRQYDWSPARKRTIVCIGLAAEALMAASAAWRRASGAAPGRQSLRTLLSVRSGPTCRLTARATPNARWAALEWPPASSARPRCSAATGSSGARYAHCRKATTAATWSPRVSAARPVSATSRVWSASGWCPPSDAIQRPASGRLHRGRRHRRRRPMLDAGGRGRDTARRAGRRTSRGDGSARSGRVTGHSDSAAPRNR